MKKHFFFFAMLASVAASATVKVTPLSTDYSANKVTFKVEWTNAPSAPYNNRVWVWVDFCQVTGTMPATSFSIATISNPTKIDGNGTVTNATTRGFFIEYGTTNSGTTVTATLNASGKFNWCAYGSDYPPNVLANTNGSYTLAGTPPFKLIASNGITTQTVNEKFIATSAVTITPAIITDATGYPGLWCPYTGNDLYMDADHRCLERQSGAGNWQAWIRDTREGGVLYRIVWMPSDKWWLAEDLRLTTTGRWFCDKAASIDPIIGRYYTVTEAKGICPTGWQVPIEAELNYLRDVCTFPALKLAGDVYWGDTTSGAQSAADGTDLYGFSLHGYGGWYQNQWLVYCRRNAMLVTQTGIWSYGCYVNGSGDCATLTPGTNNAGCFSGGNNSNMTSGILRCVRTL
jgi:uncharacterized protein (TIGR02145 family)